MKVTVFKLTIWLRLVTLLLNNANANPQKPPRQVNKRTGFDVGVPQVPKIPRLSLPTSDVIINTPNAILQGNRPLPGLLPLPSDSQTQVHQYEGIQNPPQDLQPSTSLSAEAISRADEIRKNIQDYIATIPKDFSQDIQVGQPTNVNSARDATASDDDILDDLFLSPTVGADGFLFRPSDFSTLKSTGPLGPRPFKTTSNPELMYERYLSIYVKVGSKIRLSSKLESTIECVGEGSGAYGRGYPAYIVHRQKSFTKNKHTKEPKRTLKGLIQHRDALLIAKDEKQEWVDWVKRVDAISDVADGTDESSSNSIVFQFDDLENLLDESVDTMTIMPFQLGEGVNAQYFEKYLNKYVMQGQKIQLSSSLKNSKTAGTELICINGYSTNAGDTVRWSKMSKSVGSGSYSKRAAPLKTWVVTMRGTNPDNVTPEELQQWKQWFDKVDAEKKDVKILVRKNAEETNPRVQGIGTPVFSIMDAVNTLNLGDVPEPVLNRAQIIEENGKTKIFDKFIDRYVGTNDRVVISLNKIYAKLGLTGTTLVSTGIFSGTLLYELEGFGEQRRRSLHAWVTRRHESLTLTYVTSEEFSTWSNWFAYLNQRTESTVVVDVRKDLDNIISNENPKDLPITRHNEAGEEEWFDKFIGKYIRLGDRIRLSAPEQEDGKNSVIKCIDRNPSDMTIVRYSLLNDEIRKPLPMWIRSNAHLTTSEENLIWVKFLRENSNSWNNILWDIETLKNAVYDDEDSDDEAHTSLTQDTSIISIQTPRDSPITEAELALYDELGGAFRRKKLLEKKSERESQEVFFEPILGVWLRIGDKIRISGPHFQKDENYKQRNLEGNFLKLERPGISRDELVYSINDSPSVLKNPWTLRSFIKSPDWMTRAEKNLIVQFQELEPDEFFGNWAVSTVFTETKLPLGHRRVQIGQIVPYNRRFYQFDRTPESGFHLMWERVGSKMASRSLYAWDEHDIRVAVRVENEYSERHGGEARKLLDVKRDDVSGEIKYFEAYGDTPGWLVRESSTSMTSKYGVTQLKFARPSICGTKLMYVSEQHPEHIASIDAWKNYLENLQRFSELDSWTSRPVIDEFPDLEINLDPTAHEYYKRGPSGRDDTPGWVYVYRLVADRDADDITPVLHKTGKTVNHPKVRRDQAQRNNGETYVIVYAIKTPFPYLIEGTVHTHMRQIGKQERRKIKDGKTEWARTSFNELKFLIDAVKLQTEEAIDFGLFD